MTNALNFFLLLAATCSALDAYIAQYTPRYHFLLSIISPARPTNYNILHLSEMNKAVAITDYTAAGIPTNKIVIGILLYRRSFKGTTGLGQSFTGVGSGSWENGVWDYKVLPKAGITKYFDPKIGVLYSYNASTKELISYDNVAKAKLKATYIKSNGLGGAIY
ncbi:glycosyl hydrolases family 18-domain-containing protein [Halenospora varia]|nr:glycosyl hydrolases family 18-domain-containing protein [Halenospora varia]